MLKINKNIMEEISRNKTQEIAMQILSSFLICQDEGVVINIEQTFEDFLGMSYEETPTFLKEIIIKALKNEKETITLISKYLKNWKFSRLNTCIKAILILAVTNFKYIEGMNKNIAINIAVELAKKYGEKEDYKFVNAILDNCLKNE